MASREAFPIDAAQIVGMFMESVFFGVYLVTFVRCVKVLFWRDGAFKPWHRMHHKMIVAAFLMCIFASLDVAFHLRHILEVFVGVQDSKSVIDAFNDTSYWINVMKMACYVAQTFVGDAILLYRCWIVYDKNWYVIIVSTLLWLGCTVCGAMTIYYQSISDTMGALLNARSLVPFITSMLVLTLAMNTLTTSLIVYKIWRIQDRLRRRNTYTLSNPLSRLLVVLIESGLLYTLSIVILFTLYMLGNNGQYGVSNAVVQIIGITFNLIITSVDRSDTSRGDATQNSAMSRSAAVNRVPLQTIHIQTTTSVIRYPEFDEEAKPTSPSSDADSRTEWK
ncbi:hypothetical protein FA15DRAFT_672304 [Coprinopsis marcescibilis]|uniref:G-protein coupled receptors family 1 profile domain-containing protein n=1 Tax=Coprinopsis marcescibilis TaxID=230819 RepID=A0A5C3KN10_COPMA|nr:hypothetical protein FA15DRAFT_672304 [Coprinopsis marcescibilis]